MAFDEQVLRNARERCDLFQGGAAGRDRDPILQPAATWSLVGWLPSGRRPLRQLLPPADHGSWPGFAGAACAALVQRACGTSGGALGAPLAQTTICYMGEQGRHQACLNFRLRTALQSQNQESPMSFIVCEHCETLSPEVCEARGTCEHCGADLLARAGAKRAMQFYRSTEYTAHPLGRIHDVPFCSRRARSCARVMECSRLCQRAALCDPGDRHYCVRDKLGDDRHRRLHDRQL